MGMPEKVGAGLKCCTTICEDGAPACDECPYDSDRPLRDCVRELLLDLEKQLEARDQRITELIELNNRLYAQNRWTRAENDPPLVFERVITCRKKRKSGYIIEQGHLEADGDWKIGSTRTKTVTHWMPMPLPPKE